MATADEIWADGKTSDLNNATYSDSPSVTPFEPHIVINKDRSITVPEQLKNIAVQYDHNIETVTFDCPRYWDGIDFITSPVDICYTRADGQEGIYRCEASTADETDQNIMHFNWTIKRDITEVYGSIEIEICIKKLSEDLSVSHIWHSQTCTSFNILKGLPCDAVEVPEPAQIFTQVDYNQNDSSSADYIKNRPFYEIEIMSDFTTSVDDFTEEDISNGYQQLGHKLGLKAGQIYSAEVVIPDDADNLTTVTVECRTIACTDIDPQFPADSVLMILLLPEESSILNHVSMFSTENSSDIPSNAEELMLDSCCFNTIPGASNNIISADDCIILYTGCSVTIKNLHRIELKKLDNKFIDMNTLKTDVGTLKTDVGTLKTDVGTLKTDVGTLKTDLKKNVDSNNNRLNALSNRINDNSYDISELKSVDVTRYRNDLIPLFLLSFCTEPIDYICYNAFAPTDVYAGNVGRNDTLCIEAFKTNSAKGMFKTAKNINDCRIEFLNVINLEEMFLCCETISFVQLNLHQKNVKITNAFNGCDKLTSIYFYGGSIIPGNTYTFGSSSIKNIKFLEGFGLPKTTIADSVSFRWLTKFTANQIAELFDALEDKTDDTSKQYTCTVGSTFYDQLTPEQKAVATDKGWQLN